MEWSKEIQPEVDALLEVFGNLVNKLLEEPQDNWRAGLALDSVCEMQSAIIYGALDLKRIEDHQLKKPDNVTQWWNERRQWWDGRRQIM